MEEESVNAPEIEQNAVQQGLAVRKIVRPLNLKAIPDEELASEAMDTGSVQVVDSEPYRSTASPFLEIRAPASPMASGDQSSKPKLFFGDPNATSKPNPFAGFSFSAVQQSSSAATAWATAPSISTANSFVFGNKPQSPAAATNEPKSFPFSLLGRSSNVVAPLFSFSNSIPIPSSESAKAPATTTIPWSFGSSPQSSFKGILGSAVDTAITNVAVEAEEDEAIRQKLAARESPSADFSMEQAENESSNLPEEISEVNQLETPQSPTSALEQDRLIESASNSGAAPITPNTSQPAKPIVLSVIELSLFLMFCMH